MLRNLVRSGLALAMAAAVAIPAAHAQDEESTYFGTFKYVEGKDGSGEIPKERLAGTVEITEGRIRLLGEDGQEQFAISYTVDEGEQAPYKFTMKIESSVMEDSVGATAKGLAKHEDGKTILIYDYSENPDYPDDFEPEADQHLIVLEKQPDAE